MALTADRWTHGRAATLIPDAFAVRVETAATGGTVTAKGVSWRNVAHGRS